MTGVRDVAEAAGVSVATVSRVLNDSPAVRPETRARVVRAMRELQYVSRERLDVSAGLVVAVVRSLSDPFELELVDALARHAAPHDLSVVVLSAPAERVIDDPGVAGLIERGVAGLVLIGCSQPGDGAWIVEEGLPTVVVGGSPVTGAAHVDLGEAEAVRLALAEVRNAGGARILAVGAATGRSEVALTRLAAAGVETVRGAANLSAIRSTLGARLAQVRSAGPTAIVATTEAHAFAVLAAAAGAGVAVPEELTVIALESSAATRAVPGLLTIPYSLGDVARRTIDAVTRLIEDPEGKPLESD